MHELPVVLGGLCGLGLLYFGAEWLVRGGSALAGRARVSPLVIGLTLVAFGTSAPELFVSAGAAVAGLGDVCVGNIVGSNICNILLILGLSGLVAPMDVNPALVRRDVPVMVAVSAALAVLCRWCGGIGRTSGTVLLLGLAGYTCWGILDSRRSGTACPAARSAGAMKSALLTVSGLVALVVGAKLILLGALALERGLGIPDEFVALTVVAAGTSLPELATSVVAARRGEADIAIGNIVGSNIFNILGILGLSALLKPVTPTGMGGVDLAMMVGSAVLLWPLALLRGRLGRIEGALMLAGYAGYVLWLCHATPLAG